MDLPVRRKVWVGFTLDKISDTDILKMSPQAGDYGVLAKL